jgi:hypothetical protein
MEDFLALIGIVLWFAFVAGLALLPLALVISVLI